MAINAQIVVFLATRKHHEAASGSMADRTQRILAEPYTRFYITKKGFRA
jgi:hypothetical protein